MAVPRPGKNAGRPTHPVTRPTLGELAVRKTATTTTNATGNLQPAQQNQAPATRRVLAVGPSGRFQGQLQRTCEADGALELTCAANLRQGREMLRQEPIDLVLLKPELPDGSGLTLAEELACSRQLVRTVVLTDEPSAELATTAMRAGACDLLETDMPIDELAGRLRQALEKPTRDHIQAQRLERLHRLCQRLNQARQEVAQQVDLLCHDLVTAYQELACQLDQAMHGAEYGAAIGDELELETLIRRTLEHLTRKLGRAHGAVYLPASADEFSLGGYASHDTTDGPADMALEDLADRLAPAVAECRRPIHLKDPEQLHQWLGSAVGPLAGHELVAFPCRDENETLAVVVLFRDAGEPFAEEAVEVASAVGDRLGQALGRMIRIHHRHIPDQ
jgi:DNA-binding response OmpR family regulator